MSAVVWPTAPQQNSTCVPGWITPPTSPTAMTAIHISLEPFRLKAANIAATFADYSKRFGLE